MFRQLIGKHCLLGRLGSINASTRGKPKFSSEIQHLRTLGKSAKSKPILFFWSHPISSNVWLILTFVFRGGEWNSGGHCKEGIRPLNRTLKVSYPEKNVILEEILKQMKTPVTLLNITYLSGYRIDGHPSIYGKKPRNRQSSSGQDCSHWCLPGVPDTWNELLYFHLQSKQWSSSW